MPGEALPMVTRIVNLFFIRSVDIFCWKGGVSEKEDEEEGPRWLWWWRNSGNVAADASSDERSFGNGEVVFVLWCSNGTRRVAGSQLRSC